jgi:hypothetical protein
MKITRILPKPLAIAWQEYDINKLETLYEYHQMIADNCKARLYEGRDELERLRGKYHGV